MTQAVNFCSYFSLGILFALDFLYQPHLNYSLLFIQISSLFIFFLYLLFSKKNVPFSNVFIMQATGFFLVFLAKKLNFIHLTNPEQVSLLGLLFMAQAIAGRESFAHKFLLIAFNTLVIGSSGSILALKVVLTAIFFYLILDLVKAIIFRNLPVNALNLAILISIFLFHPETLFTFYALFTIFFLLGNSISPQEEQKKESALNLNGFSPNFLSNVVYWGSICTLFFFYLLKGKFGLKISIVVLSFSLIYLLFFSAEGFSTRMQRLSGSLSRIKIKCIEKFTNVKVRYFGMESSYEPNIASIVGKIVLVSIGLLVFSNIRKFNSDFVSQYNNYFMLAIAGTIFAFTLRKTDKTGRFLLFPIVFFAIIIFIPCIEFIFFNLVPGFKNTMWILTPNDAKTYIGSLSNGWHRFWGIFAWHPAPTVLVTAMLGIALDEIFESKFFRISAISLSLISLSGTAFIVAIIVGATFVTSLLSSSLIRKKLMINLAISMGLLIPIFITVSYFAFADKLNIKYLNVLNSNKFGQIFSVFEGWKLMTWPECLFGADIIKYSTLIPQIGRMREFYGSADFAIIFRAVEGGSIGIFLFVVQYILTFLPMLFIIKSRANTLLFAMILVVSTLHYSPLNNFAGSIALAMCNYILFFTATDFSPQMLAFKASIKNRLVF